MERGPYLDRLDATHSLGEEEERGSRWRYPTHPNTSITLNSSSSNSLISTYLAVGLEAVVMALHLTRRRPQRWSQRLTCSPPIHSPLHRHPPLVRNITAAVAAATAAGTTDDGAAGEVEEPLSMILALCTAEGET